MGLCLYWNACWDSGKHRDLWLTRWNLSNSWSGAPQSEVSLVKILKPVDLKITFKWRVPSKATFFFGVFYLSIWLPWVIAAASMIFIVSCEIFCYGTQTVWLWHTGPRDAGSCGTQAELLSGMWDLGSLIRDRTHVPCIARQIPNHWTTRDVPWWVFQILTFIPISGWVKACQLEFSVHSQTRWGTSWDCPHPNEKERD